MSDEDRRYDAWIPSQHTQQILVEMTTGATAAPLNATIEHLTMPGIVLDEPLVRPMCSLQYMFASCVICVGIHV